MRTFAAFTTPAGVCLPTRCANRASSSRSFLDFPLLELKLAFDPRAKASFLDGDAADAEDSTMGGSG